MTDPMPAERLAEIRRMNDHAMTSCTNVGLAVDDVKPTTPAPTPTRTTAEETTP